MDACGAHTRTLDNHHGHDSDQRNTERLTNQGKVREILHREKPPNVGGVGGSAWDATPDWETEPKMRASITRRIVLSKRSPS